MGALWLRTNRWLTWFHRWSGVVLFLLFIAWFASGTVLLFVPFPSLPEADRLAHSEPIDASQLTRDPVGVLANRPGTEQLLLVSVAGHPMFLAFAADGQPVAVPGDDRAPPGLFSADVARTVAERYGEASAQGVDGPLQYDQWIVHQHYDPFRPFYRVRLSDADRTDLYVSARTGQVLQKTRGAERAWNWCGAVLHWIYFTPLRKSWFAWNEVVWWLSLVALLASIAGTWLGIHRSATSQISNTSRSCARSATTVPVLRFRSTKPCFARLSIAFPTVIREMRKRFVSVNSVGMRVPGDHSPLMMGRARTRRICCQIGPSPSRAAMLGAAAS
jgi:PepSY-associated TM region